MLRSLQEKGVISTIGGKFHVTSSIGQGEPLGLVNTADFGELYHKTPSLDGIVIPSVEYSFAIKLKVI